ncbi:sirohydrochlorin cobaltochelatase [[Clostridium] polysaccharolyticum]|uniref:Sirohydrochlorin cobaltochelatase n=1 Tax=[Clostridium] polysaccharolyticum TaxID=29364 RepID=A0A1H9Y5J3_9FIRM|nr:sirohydrochlorin cobaltochelatase [[Clostridium] polysaccharolyticum]SES63666.1 sirohydrochlorin cobaltochelatase [[Clostridium] polysaccharolyticum]
MKKKALLVASFGTSYEETRKKTIGAIEESLQKEFEQHQVYRAFTSKIIKRKLEREGVFIFDVKEALEKILEDGFTDVLIQPTHIINGTEYDLLREDIVPFFQKFKSITIGRPLLTKHEDYMELADIIKETYPVEQDEALVLMGHGSKHPANSSYPAFEYVLKDKGYDTVFVGTVEGYPSLKEVKKQLVQNKIKKVCLVPMMIVAGDHANKDLIGDEDSWKMELKKEGYQVRYDLRGLGELEAVQKMFIRNAKEAVAIR